MIPRTARGGPAGHHGPGGAVTARTRPWPLLVIAAPAAVAVWSGWVGLGGMCGFGVINLLPGLADGLRVNTAITLPVGVESYGAYALYVWIRGGGSGRTRAFARHSAVGALILGCLGQVVFHLLAAARQPVAPWPVVMLVSCLPVVTVFAAAMLVHLVRADASGATGATAGDSRDSGATLAVPALRHDDGIMASPVPSGGSSAVPPRTGSDRVRDILSRDPALPKVDVAALAAVHVRTVERVKREM